MSRYRKINPAIWNDAKFRSLTNFGKLSFLLLLTHPHTSSIGTLRASSEGLEHDLEGFGKGFAELLEKGMAKESKDAPLIYLPKFLRHNQPENPNCVKSWHHALEELPECDLYPTIIQDLRGFAKQLPEGFRKAFREPFGEPFAQGLANQEQEQEQEQKHKQEQEQTPPLPPTKAPSKNGQNRVCDTGPQSSTSQAPTAALTQEQFNALWAEYPGAPLERAAAFSCVQRLLAANGTYFSDLLEATKRYRRACEAAQVEERFIQQPKNFFSQGGLYADAMKPDFVERFVASRRAKPKESARNQSAALHQSMLEIQAREAARKLKQAGTPAGGKA